MITQLMRTPPQTIVVDVSEYKARLAALQQLTNPLLYSVSFSWPCISLLPASHSLVQHQALCFHPRHPWTSSRSCSVRCTNERTRHPFISIRRQPRSWTCRPWTPMTPLWIRLHPLLFLACASGAKERLRLASVRSYCPTLRSVFVFGSKSSPQLYSSLLMCMHN